MPRQKIDEEEFQKWYRSWASRTNLDLDPDDPLHKYDYRAAFLAGEEPLLSPLDNQYHWPSRFKALDHPNRFVNGIDTITGQRIPERDNRRIRGNKPGTIDPDTGISTEDLPSPPRGLRTVPKKQAAGRKVEEQLLNMRLGAALSPVERQMLQAIQSRSMGGLNSRSTDAELAGSMFGQGSQSMDNWRGVQSLYVPPLNVLPLDTPPLRRPPPLFNFTQGQSNAELERRKRELMLKEQDFQNTGKYPELTQAQKDAHYEKALAATKAKMLAEAERQFRK